MTWQAVCALGQPLQPPRLPSAAARAWGELSVAGGQAEPWPERGAEVHVLSLKVGGCGSSFGSPTFQWLSAEFPSLKPIRPAVRGARRGARQ
jgi:hypothetical protein